MDDTQRGSRVAESEERAQTDECRSPEASARTVTRSLANPRRIRLD
jgi:hypothetical protein